MATPIRALHYPLQEDPGGNRLRRETDYDAYVIQLIKQVLLTSPGERVNRPDLGGGVKRLVFHPLGPATATLAETMVYKALTDSLSALIRVDEVKVAIGDARLNITVTYTLFARMEKRVLNLEVTV
jgi:phage baseplate assembly protein W